MLPLQLLTHHIQGCLPALHKRVSDITHRCTQQLDDLGEEVVYEVCELGVVVTVALPFFLRAKQCIDIRQ